MAGGWRSVISKGKTPWGLWPRMLKGPTFRRVYPPPLLGSLARWSHSWFSPDPSYIVDSDIYFSHTEGSGHDKIRIRTQCLHLFLMPRAILFFNSECLLLHLEESGPISSAAAKLLQSCPTLCDPIDSSPPGSPVSGILQTRTLEWVAISFSSAWKWKVKVKSLSLVWLCATPWTAAYQAPPSMRFSRQENWNGVPLPSPNLIWGPI